MTIVDTGRGTPVVIVPGVQGRWEYMRGTVEAFSRTHRAISYSLLGEPGTSPGVAGGVTIDGLAAQLKGVLDARNVDRAVICGVSFGGLVALRFAVLHPDRAMALVLASVPGPGWRLRESHRAYVRFPWLAAPLFLAGAPARLRLELVSALPDRQERHALIRQLLTRLISTPVSPARMAARARLIDGLDNTAECARLSVPSLILTGEPELDHVVPAGGSSVYAALICGARTATLERTGHLGCVTRPQAFAAVVTNFLREVGLEQAA